MLARHHAFPPGLSRKMRSFDMTQIWSLDMSQLGCTTQPRRYVTWPPVWQAKEREQESEKRLSLLEEQLSVKEKTLALMEVDLEKVNPMVHSTED